MATAVETAGHIPCAGPFKGAPKELTARVVCPPTTQDIDVPPSDSHETLRTAFVSRNLEPREAARAAAAAAARGWRVAPAGDDSHASTSSATAPAAELQWVLPKEVDWDRVGPRRLCNRLRIRPGLIHKDKLAQVLRASLPARHGALAGGEGALVPETHVLEDSDELVRFAVFHRQNDSPRRGTPSSPD